MGKKADKALLASLQQMMMQQMQQANTPDPTITRLMGLNNAILDWHTNPTNTVKDIYKHPTLGSKLPVFQMAKQNMDAGRVGRGVLGRTSLNNDRYGADMKLEDDFNRSMGASGILEMGLQDELGNAQKNMAGLVDLDYSRKSGANSLMGGLYNSLYSSANKPGGWAQFGAGLLRGVGSSL